MNFDENSKDQYVHVGSDKPVMFVANVKKEQSLIGMPIKKKTCCCCWTMKPNPEEKTRVNPIRDVIVSFFLIFHPAIQRMRESQKEKLLMLFLLHDKII